MPIRRRTLAGALAAPFAPPLAASLARPAIAQRVVPLRFVPQANLSVLDPIWTTGLVTQNHAFYVYDTLYAVGPDLVPKPQMAEGHTVSEDSRTWRITLRPGLRFHDGEPVRAADCAASLARWARRDVLGQLLERVLDRFVAVDDRTLDIRLTTPFPILLDALGKPFSNIPVIMPERLARTDANTQVTEVVGSGPYRFLAGEFVTGSRVAYARFDGYVPRSEPPEWQTGAKVAHFERIEWHIIPDAATAAAALQTGEIDWWEQPLADLLPVLARNRAITIDTIDDSGILCLLRFNALHPPFNNVRVRQAIQLAVSQPDYMAALVGPDRRLWTENFSLFTKGLPLYDEAGPGAARMMAPRDMDRARAALREAGYAGERVVTINPTDFPSIGPMGRITHDMLRRLGMNSELVETDWGSVLQRRASREPVDRGGWSIFHTWTPGSSVTSPVTTIHRGQGLAGWAGWFESAEAEGLLAEWLAAPDREAQRRIALAINRTVMDQVSAIPLGLFRMQSAWRGITGVLKGTAPYPWNVRRA